jgi:periplasmic protein TonB
VKVPKSRASRGFLFLRRTRPEKKFWCLYQQPHFHEEVSAMEGMMFADAVTASWHDRLRRGWMTLTSFALQATAALVLLLLPLLRPIGLPSLRQLSTPVSLGHQGDSGQQPHPVRPQTRSMPVIVPDPVLVFRQSPNVQPASPSYDGDATSGPPGPIIPGTQFGDERGVPHLFDDGVRPVLPTPAPVTRTIRLSQMSEGSLIRRVQPVYPALARSARIQGVVVLDATISKQGVIENLRLISGHPMLAPAAIDAVRQWRYKPYILNGEPVEVETQVTVNFSLNN